MSPDVVVRPRVLDVEVHFAGVRVARLQLRLLENKPPSVGLKFFCRCQLFGRGRLPRPALPRRQRRRLVQPHGRQAGAGGVVAGEEGGVQLDTGDVAGEAEFDDAPVVAWDPFPPG